MRRTTPVTTKTPTFSSDDYKTAILSEFRGIDESVNPFNVVKNSAKEINNLYLDDEGTMVTRPRLEYVQKLSHIGVYFNTFKIFDKDKKWIWVMVYTKPYKIYVKVDENSPFVEYSLETASVPYLYEIDSFGAIFDNEKNKYLIGSVGNVSKLYVVDLDFTTKTIKLTPADAYIPTTKNYDISTDTEYTFEQANLWSPEVKWAAYWNPDYFNNEEFRERKYVVADNKYYSKMFDCRYEGYTFVDYVMDYVENSVVCLWYKQVSASFYTAIIEYMTTSGEDVKVEVSGLRSQPSAATYIPKNKSFYLETVALNETTSNSYGLGIFKISNTGTVETEIYKSTAAVDKRYKGVVYFDSENNQVIFGYGYVADTQYSSKMYSYLYDTMTSEQSYVVTSSKEGHGALCCEHYCIDSKNNRLIGTGGHATEGKCYVLGFYSERALGYYVSYRANLYNIVRDFVWNDSEVITEKAIYYFYPSRSISDSKLGVSTFKITWSSSNAWTSKEIKNKILNQPTDTLMMVSNGNLWVCLYGTDNKWIWYGNVDGNDPDKANPYDIETIQLTNFIPFRDKSFLTIDGNNISIYKFDETSPKPLLFFAVNGAVEKPGHINRVDRYNNNFVFWSTETNTVYFTKNNDPTYIPEAYYDRYGGADGVKSVMRISDEYLAVLKENDTFLTWTSNDLFYSNELRTRTGSSKTDSSIVCNYSNLPIMINEDGVWSLGQSSSVNYQDTIYSSMTDQIDKSFTSISPDKYYLHNHKYYTYIGENNGDDCIMWVFDNRIGMWYKWTLPIRIAGFIEIDDVTYVVNEYGDRLYKLEINSKRLYPELDDTSYVDEIWSAATDSLYYRNIDWKWVSQPIYLNTLNYKKRMRYLKLIFANKYESDHITFKYWFKTYTQTEYPTNPKTYTAAIASLKTQKFRPHIPKFDFIQIILESNNSSDEFEDGEGNVVPTTLNDKIGFVSIALNYILLEG